MLVVMSDLCKNQTFDATVAPVDEARGFRSCLIWLWCERPANYIPGVLMLAQNVHLEYAEAHLQMQFSTRC